MQLGIRVFRGPKLPKTHSKLIVGAAIVVKRDIMLTDAPIRALVLISPLQLHLPPTHGANSILVAVKQNYACGRVNATKQNYACGRVNHVAVEEAQEAPDVVIGMFLVNDTSAVVLLDSEASHSFISAVYVEKHNLLLALLKCQMIVSSP
jgi:hypothetical protein